VAEGEAPAGRVSPGGPWCTSGRPASHGARLWPASRWLAAVRKPPGPA